MYLTPLVELEIIEKDGQTTLREYDGTDVLTVRGKYTYQQIEAIYQAMKSCFLNGYGQAYKDLTKEMQHE